MAVSILSACWENSKDGYHGSFSGSHPDRFKQLQIGPPCSTSVQHNFGSDQHAYISCSDISVNIFQKGCEQAGIGRLVSGWEIERTLLLAKLRARPAGAGLLRLCS